MQFCELFLGGRKFTWMHIRCRSGGIFIWALYTFFNWDSGSFRTTFSAGVVEVNEASKEEGDFT